MMIGMTEKRVKMNNKNGSENFIPQYSHVEQVPLNLFFLRRDIYLRNYCVVDGYDWRHDNNCGSRTSCVFGVSAIFTIDCERCRDGIVCSFLAHITCVFKYSI